MKRPKTKSSSSITEAIAFATPKLEVEELLRPPPLFDEVITKPMLKEWTTEVPAEKKRRTALLADTVWGTIMWERNLGRPATPRLADGFVIHHVSTNPTEHTSSSADPRGWDFLSPHPEPRKWDGPHDATYYRVSFVTKAYGAPEDVNRLEVAFAGGVPWIEKKDWARARGIRRISYARASRSWSTPSRKLGGGARTAPAGAASYFSASGKSIVLDPFEVTYFVPPR